MNDPIVVGDATRRMVRFLSDRTDDGRLVRGHEILDDGLLEEVVIDEAKASAKVVGTGRYPYDVTMRYVALSRFDERATRFDCTCPDWGDPCKHGVALALAVATRLDIDEARRDAHIEEKHAGPGEHVEPPSDRPQWAEAVVEQLTPHTFDDWLGSPDRTRLKPVMTDTDPFDTLLALGKLAIPGGPDLAPEIALLASRLRDG
jgi:SWIM zinc finger